MKFMVGIKPKMTFYKPQQSCLKHRRPYFNSWSYMYNLVKILLKNVMLSKFYKKTFIWCSHIQKLQNLFIHQVTMETWSEFLSASLYTATVLIPNLLAVCITRHAISPLLAIKIFSMGLTPTMYDKYMYVFIEGNVHSLITFLHVYHAPIFWEGRHIILQKGNKWYISPKMVKWKSRIWCTCIIGLENQEIWQKRGFILYIYVNLLPTLVISRQNLLKLFSDFTYRFFLDFTYNVSHIENTCMLKNFLVWTYHSQKSWIH